MSVGDFLGELKAKGVKWRLGELNGGRAIRADYICPLAVVTGLPNYSSSRAFAEAAGLSWGDASLIMRAADGEDLPERNRALKEMRERLLEACGLEEAS